MKEMGSRFPGYARNGHTNAQYGPLHNEDAAGSPSDTEEFHELNSFTSSDILIKLDDPLHARDGFRSPIDSSRNTCESVIQIGSPTEGKLTHSRQSSSSSASDFRPSSKQYPDEKLKTLSAFGFLLLGVWSSTISLATVHDRLPSTAPLPDVIFSLVPQWDVGLAISEYIIMLCVYPVFVLIFLHRYRWIVARRVFMMVGLLYMGRAITMLVTSVPVANANYYCAPKSNVTHPFTVLSRAWTLMTGFGMSINGKHFYCGDYIYSGHTCMLVLSALIFGEYLPRKGVACRILRAFFYVCSCLGVILVSVSRGHYTVDILIAYAVTTIIFWIYHTVVSFPILKNPSSPNNHLAQLWWFRVLIFFEKNVPEGKLPVRFNWPLPFPRRLVSWKLDFVE